MRRSSGSPRATSRSSASGNASSRNVSAVGAQSMTTASKAGATCPTSSSARMSSTPGTEATSCAASGSRPLSPSRSPTRRRRVVHAESIRARASICITDRSPGASVTRMGTPAVRHSPDVPRSDSPRTSVSECAGSVLTTRVRRPVRAAASADAAARVVLPTPPLPTTRSTRTRGNVVVRRRRDEVASARGARVRATRRGP